MSRAFARLCFPVLLALPLFGCGPARDQFPPACPSAHLVSGLSEMTRYAGAGTAHDFRDMVIHAKVLAVNGKCMSSDNPGILPASVRITIGVQRGPAMQGRSVTVPVFLAVLRGTTVEDKKIFDVPVTFPAQQEQMSVTSPDIALDLPVSSTISGPSYSIVAGFQLSPDELATNRHAGG